MLRCCLYVSACKGSLCESNHAKVRSFVLFQGKWKSGMVGVGGMKRAGSFILVSPLSIFEFKTNCQNQWTFVFYATGQKSDFKFVRHQTYNEITFWKNDIYMLSNLQIEQILSRILPLFRNLSRACLTDIGYRCCSLMERRWMRHSPREYVP